jgi:hypothetical protein
MPKVSAPPLNRTLGIYGNEAGIHCPFRRRSGDRVFRLRPSQGAKGQIVSLRPVLFHGATYAAHHQCMARGEVEVLLQCMSWGMGAIASAAA